MSIGDGRTTYSDVTLNSMSKNKLINIIRCLEDNLKNANKRNEIQYENFTVLLGKEYEILDDFSRYLFDIVKKNNGFLYIADVVNCFEDSCIFDYAEDFKKGEKR